MVLALVQHTPRPTARTDLSCGFPVAVSRNTMPLDVMALFGLGTPTTRSPGGLLPW
jgi:hypothetical protein